MVALNSKNIPPISIISCRALKLISDIENSGVVSVTNQPVNINNKIRVINAKARPVTRALSRCWGGSFSARMAIKTMLSIPRTISSTTRVDKPIQIVGSMIHSICQVITSNKYSTCCVVILSVIEQIINKIFIKIAYPVKNFQVTMCFSINLAFPKCWCE
ncbi:putative 18.9 kDa protein [Gilliamella apicola]|nr:putative 18.9 kDa protein [Gilliamella apicola]